MMPAKVSMRTNAVSELQRIGRDARVYVSMPVLEGVTPRVLSTRGEKCHFDGEPLERRQGVFRIDEVGVPVFDHGVLYGDGVFEGILVSGGRLFLLREHLERLWASADQLSIPIPTDAAAMTSMLLRSVRDTGTTAEDTAYIRLVVTRGIGDLGIHPTSCIGSTIYSIAAKIQLYPEAAYHRGIAVAVSRETRRIGANILDPRIKSCNYLNNILGLLTTLSEGCLETVMLTHEGYVAEATADNMFLVERGQGWEADPSKVRVITPSGDYCLNGITRKVILEAAVNLGYQTVESAQMVPSDWMGVDREGFLTGTGAGLMPIVSMAGHTVGDGHPGVVTMRLRDQLRAALANPAYSISMDASKEEIAEYLGVAVGELVTV